MKTVKYEKMKIDNFKEFYAYLHKNFEGILGAEWNEDAKTLKIFYEDTATELPIETLKALRLPITLRFKKKITKPSLDVPNASITAISENEFIVETFDAEAMRKKVKEKLPEFEELPTG